MTRTVIRGAISLALLAGLAGGCATPPHRFRYQPADWVRAADRRACHEVAERAAQQRYKVYTETIELAGEFGGPFGGVTLAQRARDEREDVYEMEMKSCLRERGYPL